MDIMQQKWAACAALVAMMVLPALAQAGTFSYYRFETGPAGTVPTIIVDSSGNNRDGSLFSGFPTYSANVPVAQIPQTGETNNFSMNFGGPDVVSFAYAFPFQTLTNATM